MWNFDSVPMVPIQIAFHSTTRLRVHSPALSEVAPEIAQQPLRRSIRFSRAPHPTTDVIIPGQLLVNPSDNDHVDESRTS